MNRTDLRTELSTRAGESDRHAYADLMPGVRRKIRTTKRRRVATALAGTAAVAAIAAGVLPTLTDTSTPDPAQSPTATPTTVTRNGITFEDTVGGQPLQAAGIGRTGQTTVSFDWTPTTDAITFRTVCSSSTDASMEIAIDDIDIASAECLPGATEPSESTDLVANDALWTHLRPGTPARVELTLTRAADSQPRTDAKAVLAAGIYAGPTGTAQPDPMPSQQPPTGSDDYVKDGVRYRAKVGGDTLIAAAIADQGRNELTFKFTPQTTDLSLRSFCLAGTRQWLSVSINGKPMTSGTCNSRSTDPGAEGGMSGVAGEGLANVVAGRPNTVQLRLTDRHGKTVSLPSARIGLGIYRIGAQQLVEGDGDRLPLDEVKEYNGYLYKLAGYRTAPATTGSVKIDTPGGIPFLIAYGSTETGIPITRVQVDGLDEHPGVSGPNGAGWSVDGQPARKAGTATLKVVDSRPVKGKLVIAVYELIR